jgi:hypothetical protein
MVLSPALQVQLLDNKAYESLSRSQPSPLSAQQLAACTVKNRPLLKCGAGQAAACITLPLQVRKAASNGCCCPLAKMN